MYLVIDNQGGMDMSYKIENFNNVHMKNEVNKFRNMLISSNMIQGRISQEQQIVLSYIIYLLNSLNNPIKFTKDSIEQLELDEEIYMFIEPLLDTLNYDLIQKSLNEYSLSVFEMSCLLPCEDIFRSGNDSTPESISKLVNKILDIKEDDNLADICCGVGNYMTYTALTNAYKTINGFEINVGNAIVAKIRAKLLGESVNVTIGDVFELAESNRRFDKIFSNYPFGMRMKELAMKGLSILDDLSNKDSNISRATSSDWLFNWLICNLLEDNGKAVAIMTNGSTFNKIDTPIRKYFIEKGLIETVISLPDKMFVSTAIPTSVIVFSRNNESIKFVNAKNLCEKGRRNNYLTDANITEILEAITNDNENSLTVLLEDLKNNDYVLNYDRYNEKAVSYDNGVKFSEIINTITRGAACKANDLDEITSEEPTNFQYLMLSNIQNGIIDNNLPYLKEIDDKYRKYCLKNDDLILSKNGYPYKIAVASISDEKEVLANGNLYIIDVDKTKANPYYLKAFFESEEGVAALKRISVGSVIPNIGLSSLKELEIPLPSLEEQNKVANRYLAIVDEITMLNHKLDNAVKRLNEVFNQG